MLPLKPFSFICPQSVNELVAELKTADGRTKIMAGGTDLLPNLKHRLYDVDRIITLKRVRELDHITVDKTHIELGALATLSRIARDATIIRLLPAVARASSQIASPQIRNMGTVGGNICLDTRCLYFNQTEFWRRSLGYCLKKDGNCCHVVKTGKRCVAAASNDLATALLAHGAHLNIASSAGNTSINLDAFYTANGEKNNPLTADQVVTSVTVDIVPRKLSGFFKLRHRLSIDFPLLSVAVSLRLDDAGRLDEGCVVVNALVAKPKVMDLAQFKGVFYNHKLVEEIAQSAESKCHPQTNICDDPAWRKNMVAYAVTRAFNDALLIPV